MMECEKQLQKDLNTQSLLLIIHNIQELKLHGLVNDIAIDTVYDDILEQINDEKPSNDTYEDIVVDDDTE